MAHLPVHPMPDIVNPMPGQAPPSHAGDATGTTTTMANTTRLRDAQDVVPATAHPVLQHQMYSNKDEFKRMLHNEIQLFESRLHAEVSGFKRFISERRLVNFAVAAILGRALVSLLTSLVVDLIAPVLSFVLDQNLINYYYVGRCPAKYPDCTSSTWPTVDQAVASGALTINYGRFLQNCLEFFIFTIVLYVTARKAMNLLFIFSAPNSKEVAQAPAASSSAAPAPCSNPVDLDSVQRQVLQQMVMQPITR